MSAEAKFTFAALERPTRRHIRVFQLHQFLDRFAMGLTVAVVALALTDRGMDLVQISLLFGVYSLTTMATELPFGGVADRIGRKPVFLAAVVASLLSLSLFIASRSFIVMALSFAFIGLGRALRSGTLDAWFLEVFKTHAPKVDVQPALALAQWAGAMGLALGAVCGGVLPDLFGAVAARYGFSIYDVSYAASWVVMIGVFAYTLAFVVEPPRPTQDRALGAGLRSVPQAIKDAGLLVLRHPAVSVLMAALAFFLMGSNPVEVIWPTFAVPMLDAAFANSVIGALTAIYFFAIAFGAWLSPYVSRIFKRQHAITLAAAFACLTVAQIMLSLQAGILGFAAVFVAYSVLLGLIETPASSVLHRCVEDSQRSTILSLRSLIQQLGAVLGLVACGAIAEVYSTSVAWQIGAVFVSIAAVLSGVLFKRLATMTD